MRLIDADALIQKANYEADGMTEPFKSQIGVLVEWLVEKTPTIEPERKKDTIQKFHDYQVEWLLAHCDLELEPQLEEWVVRFLHDTANCYMMEMGKEEGEQE